MKDNFDEDKLKQNINVPSGVPEIINERIDNTLKNLEHNKQNHRFTKKASIAAAVCICTISMGSLVTFGKDLPVIKSLVGFVNPSAAKNYENVKTAINSINKSATDKGITVTINDMSYDGTTLIVGLNVSKQGGFDSDKNNVDMDLSANFYSDKTTYIPLKKSDEDALVPFKASVTCKSANSYLSKQDGGDYKGYASCYFGDEAGKIQDDDTLTLYSGEIGNVQGQWKIDTGLKIKDIYTASKVTKSNDLHKIENGQVDSVKITRSPLSNVICLKGTYNSNSENIKTAFPGFFILDDKGNCLNYQNLIGEMSNEGAFNVNMSIMGIAKDTKKLTVLPYKRVSSIQKQYSTDITKLPAQIKIQDKTVNISDVERDKGKFIMHYTINGLTDSRYSTYFEFLDKNGNKIEQKDIGTKRIAPLDYETGRGTYEFKTDKSEDIVRVVCYGFDYEIMNNYKFDVELK